MFRHIQDLANKLFPGEDYHNTPAPNETTEQFRKRVSEQCDKARLAYIKKQALRDNVKYALQNGMVTQSEAEQYITEKSIEADMESRGCYRDYRNGGYRDRITGQRFDDYGEPVELE